MVFITADLTGLPGIIDQPGDFYSGYELAMCQPRDEIENPLDGRWILSQIAEATTQMPYRPLHTIDIRAKDGPPIDGLIFTTRHSAPLWQPEHHHSNLTERFLDL